MRPLPALNLAGSNRLPHLISRILILGFIVLVLFIFFAPWRQFVRGSGRVIAFDPLERRVSVEALVSGRVKKINVTEGQRVKSGDVLAEIEDNDPDLLKNLSMQKETLEGRIEFAKSRVTSHKNQITDQTTAKDRAVDAATQAVSASKIASETAELNYKRVKRLFDQGLESQRAYEEAILRRDSLAADYLARQASLAQTASQFQSTISGIEALRDSASADFARANEELTALSIRIKQSQRQTVEAPRDGIVFQVLVTDGSYLKPGDPICVIIPETDSRFVEIMVDGNDMPLIKARSEVDGKVTPGSPVRLTFEGWPAVQMIGWPQLAVGTFGGEVVFVDATDDGKGSFRVLVGPATDVVDRGDGKGQVNVGWPDADRWLRQGVRAKGWIMLDEVPLWLELWRQMNGFPAIGEGVKDADTTKK